MLASEEGLDFMELVITFYFIPFLLKKSACSLLISLRISASKKHLQSYVTQLDE
jgi:hypothetical protein